MATAYTPILQLALPVTGELQGTWGTVVNDNITSMIEQAIAGLATINTWTTASHTLTTANGTTSEARCAVLECSGAPGAAATVICPASTKLYVIKNSVTGGFAVTLKTSAGSGISVPNGSTALLYCDGTNVVSGATYMATVSTTQVDILAQGDLRLQDSTGGEYVALQAPATIASSYTLTLPVDDGTAGQALVTDGSGVLSWSTAASGDVYGPASATDNAVARYDGTTGKIIQNSAVTIADDGATVIDVNSTSAGLRITQVGTGNALLVEDSANPDATPTVIAADGVLRVGSLTNNNTVYGASQFAPGFQLYNTSGTGGFYRYATDADGSALIFAKSRNATVGSQTVVNSSDTLGYLGFAGSDGTNFTTAATITGAVDGTPGTGDMPGRLVFATTADGASSPTERMRITSAGNVGIGGTAQAFEKLVLAGTFPSGSANTRANVVSGTIPSSTTSLFNGFRTEPTTQAASFTLGVMTHFSANQGTLGAGSAVTNQYGFSAESNLIGATNNYGFLGNIASGTGRWNFYAAGTADNYMAGKLGVGTANPPTTLFHAAQSSDGEIFRLQRSGGSNLPILRINLTESTAIAEIEQTGAIAGSIAFKTGTAERGRVSGAGVWSLGAAPGAESLRVTPVASAVNYWESLGASTGISPVFQAAGSDTNIGAVFATKGTGGHLFRTNGNTANTQFLVAHTASAVNYLQVTGAATGGGPAISAQGSDANVTLFYVSRGTSPHIFLNASGAEQFRVAVTASAVNFLQTTGSVAGGAVNMSVQGSDTNISLAIAAKGTGSVFPRSAGTTPFYVDNPSYGAAFAVTQPGGTTTNANYLQISATAAAGTPAITTIGSDTNIDLALTPKGTGVLRFGTYTAGAVTQAGYITIKDAAGNVRRLLVG